MKYLKLFERFSDEDRDEFMSILRGKLLDLSDIGFDVIVNDKIPTYVGPLRHNLIIDKIRIDIKRENSSFIDKKPFKFSEVSDVLSDIIFTNIEMNLYKKSYVIATPISASEIVNRRSVISYFFDGQKCKWYYEYTRLLKMNINPLDLDCEYIELHFE